MSMRDAFRKAGMEVPEKPEPKSENKKNTAPRFTLEKNYASQADRIIKGLKSEMGRDYNNFTTSKIRNILAMVSEIYNDVVIEKEEKLTSELQSRIEYLKVRLAYECGREPYVIKPFTVKAGLLELLDSIGDSRQRFLDFARYMEALVAYHRFYGGRD